MLVMRWSVDRWWSVCGMCYIAKWSDLSMKKKQKLQKCLFVAIILMQVFANIQFLKSQIFSGLKSRRHVKVESFTSVDHASLKTSNWRLWSSHVTQGSHLCYELSVKKMNWWNVLIPLAGSSKSDRLRVKWWGVFVCVWVSDEVFGFVG